MKLSLQQMSSIEAEILKQVRSNPGISRIALAQKLQIAPSTVGNYISRLIGEGFLVESEKTSSELGRPPTALRLSPDGGHFIGVDFEARNIMAMAVDFADRPLRQTQREIQKADTVSRIIDKIEDAIEEMLPEARPLPLAIGVGVPGLVDPIRGVALSYKYIAGWENVPLAEKLRKKFGVPVYLENTIRSMALAEQWFGQGRAMTDWVCIGIRSGIGAGIVSGGALQRGADFRAGEIGYWTCPKSALPGARYFDGSTKWELQEIASASGIIAAVERARHSKGKSLAFSDVVSAAKAGDATTIEIIAVAAEVLAWAIAQLALALNPSLVILAGSLTAFGNTLLAPVRQQAETLVRVAGGRVPAIVNSTMGQYEGAIGAAALAVDSWKPAKQAI